MDKLTQSLQYFLNASVCRSLFFCDNGNTAAWHVWWMTSPDGPWVNSLRWKWATTDQGYSIAGRVETLAGGGQSYVVYSVTLSTAANNLGQLWRYVVATGQGTG